MLTMLKFLTCFAMLLMAIVTIGSISAEAGGSGPPIVVDDDPPPRGPSAPVELPGAETP
ncbi:MAG: hypothetical protein ACR2PG_12955 [Hyphomicrobiaceae bacterium]